VIRSQFLSTLGATPVALSLPGVTATTSIAVVAPLTGPARAIGNELLRGAQGAVDEINNYSVAINTIAATYQIRSFDDQNTVADAILQAQFATGDSTVIATIGHLSGDTTVHAIPTYGNAQCPLIVPVSTDDRVTDTIYRNVFRLPTKDSSEGLIFGRVVAKQYHPKVPYILVQDADYGADVANGFIQSMNEAKTTTPYQQFSYSKPDFVAVADKALAANPDYIFLAGTVADMGGVVPVLRAKNYTGPIGASQGFFDAGTIKLGAAANDMTISTSMPFLQFAPAALRYVNDYQARYGQLSPVAAFGYAAVQLIVNTIARAGSNARNTLTSALHSGISTDTVTGSFSFDAFGDPIDPQLYFYTVRDGKFAYLHQAHPSAFMIK
jgi:ABC-type branched-subunit amino acid transport system substrate-binding protein